MNENPLAKHLVAPVHSGLVSARRCRRLASIMAHLLSDQSASNDDALTGLDIGCGTGEIAKLVEALKPQVSFTGVDVVQRTEAHIPVLRYDGVTLPFPDKFFDFTMLIDVLHHTVNPETVLKEAHRVTRSFVLVKDHYCENSADRFILSFMDWVGNRAYGVALPYNYQSKNSWNRIFDQCHLSASGTIENLDLYPFPFSLMFDRKLHFAARLNV